MTHTVSKTTLYTGAKCPYCGSDDISADAPIDGGDIDEYGQTVECCACGKTWGEWYKLVEVFDDEGQPIPGVTVAGKYAAAPDLLAALETISNWPRKSETVDGVMSADPAVGLANVRRFARAAIAKARREGV